MKSSGSRAGVVLKGLRVCLNKETDHLILVTTPSAEITCGSVAYRPVRHMEPKPSALAASDMAYVAAAAEPICSLRSTFGDL